MNLILSLLLAVLFFGSRTLLLAGSGESSAEILLHSPHPRPLSMAEAYSAIPANEGGIAAINYNPAATGFLNASEVTFTGERGFSDQNFGTLFYGYPTRWGVFAGDVLYSTLGNLELSDTSGKTYTVKAQEDYVIETNFGKRLVKNISAGINLKMIRTTLAETITASAFAADLGVMIIHQKWRGGLSFTNVGSKLKYVDQEESLPQTYRLGISRVDTVGSYGDLILSGDVIKENGKSYKEAVGFDFVWNKQVSFRGGYKFNQTTGQINFGMGIKIIKFMLDYGLSDYGDLGRSHSVALTYYFPSDAEHLDELITSPKDKFKEIWDREMEKQ